MLIMGSEQMFFYFVVIHLELVRSTHGGGAEEQGKTKQSKSSTPSYIPYMLINRYYISIPIHIYTHTQKNTQKSVKYPNKM